MFIFLHCEIHFDLLIYCLYNSLMFNNAFYIIRLLTKYMKYLMDIFVIINCNNLNNEIDRFV